MRFLKINVGVSKYLDSSFFQIKNNALMLLPLYNEQDTEDWPIYQPLHINCYFYVQTPVPLFGRMETT